MIFEHPLKLHEPFGQLRVRACLHGGGGPQVGEVTRLAVVEKWLAFTCKLTTPGSRVTLLDVVTWSLGM